MFTIAEECVVIRRGRRRSSLSVRGINRDAARLVVRTEAVKLLMQLVVIGIVGGFITWMLNERSKRKDSALMEAEKVGGAP
jgi:hypothetical protein